MVDPYDPAEFDDLGGSDAHAPDLAAARAERDAAAFHTFMTETTATLTALRADLAARKVTDLERTNHETDQRTAILARLVDPKAVASHAAAGARHGMTQAFDDLVAKLTTALNADANARNAATRVTTARLESALTAATDRQTQFLDQVTTAENARQSLTKRLAGTWVAGGASIALLVLLAGSLGYWQGGRVGQAEGYADARDEIAAASWANTTSGKLGRQLDMMNPTLFNKMVDCDGTTWDKQRVNGRKACLPGPGSEGWWREKP